MDSERYDLDAKAEGAAGFALMQGPMLQSLLEERFKLKIHRESRELPVYLMTVAKGGLRIKALPEGSCISVDLNHLPAPAQPGQPPPAYCGRQSVKATGTTLTLEMSGMSMGDFGAGILADRLDRPVLDMTGLGGLYNFHLEFAPDAGGEPAPAADSTAPALLTALREQLGLTLSAGKGTVPVLVIDRIEKPAQN